MLLTETLNSIEVNLQAVAVGNDYTIIISGGELPHIGACAVAQPRPSLQDPESVSASTSVICIMGHKEDLLARFVAEKIASRLNCVVTVNCGVHIDNANKQQIQTIQQLVNTLIDRFLGSLEK